MFQIPLKDPGIFFSQVSLPLDQERAAGRRSTVSDDLLNFVFLFSIDKVRRWCREILFINGILSVWSEKRSMEDQMDFPSPW